MRHSKVKEAASNTTCALASSTCSGFVFAAEDKSLQTALLPCPCRKLFPSFFAPMAWWPRDLGLDDLRSSRPIIEAALCRGAAYLRLPPPSSLRELCAAAAAMVLLHPALANLRTLADLYGPIGPCLTGDQLEVIRRQREIRISMGMRQSECHSLMLAAEIREHAPAFLRSPHRLGVIIVDVDEFSYLSKSSARLANFCGLVQRMEAQAMPLALVTSADLQLDAQRDVDDRGPMGIQAFGERQSYRDGQQRLRFKSSKLTERIKSHIGFADIMNPDDYDRLLDRLMAGAQLLAPHQRGGPGGRSG